MAGSKFTVPDIAARGSDIPRILDLNEVRARVPLSRTQIWRLERAGRFPKRIRLGPNRVGWREADIAAWIDSRPAA